MSKSEILYLALAFAAACPGGAAGAPMVAQAQAPPETSGVANSCDERSFKTAIDVGHTPEAPGALSARGVPEYAFNLKLAKKIEGALRDAGFDQTFLILARGAGRSQLMQRVDRANALKVDLFLSVHHDDVQAVYYSYWNDGGKRRHFSDRFSGYSLFISDANAYPRESMDFATLLGTELAARGMQFSPHHAERIRGENRELLDSRRGVYRYDQLVVLKNAKAPAVLMEAGILVNRADETTLASAQRQDLVSAAVLAAVTQFCGRPRRKTRVE